MIGLAREAEATFAAQARIDSSWYGAGMLRDPHIFGYEPCPG
jgi:hypothetical protein